MVPMLDHILLLLQPFGRPNAQAHLPGGRGELHVTKSLHARRVRCSIWFGAAFLSDMRLEHPDMLTPVISEIHGYNASGQIDRQADNPLKPGGMFGPDLFAARSDKRGGPKQYHKWPCRWEWR